MDFLIKLLIIFCLSSCQVLDLAKNKILKNSKFNFSETPSSVLIATEDDKANEFKLIHQNDDEYIWKSISYDEVLVTVNGKVIEKYNEYRDFKTSINKKHFRNFYKDGYEYDSYIEFYNPNSGTLHAKSIFSFIKEEFIQMKDGYRLKAFVYKETIYIDKLNKKYINYYWLNTDGNVIKTKQVINPLSPPITTYYK